MNQLYLKHLTDLDQWTGDPSHKPDFHFPKYKGFCILTLPNESVMRAVLSRSFSIKSKILLIREFVQDSEDMDKIDLEMCLRRVCIHNISVEITESQFLDLVQRAFGPVEKSYLRMPKDARQYKQYQPKHTRQSLPKGKVEDWRAQYGFVTFKNKADKDRAVAMSFFKDPYGKKWQIKAFRSKNAFRNYKMKQIEVQQDLEASKAEFEKFKKAKNSYEWRNTTEFQSHTGSN